MPIFAPVDKPPELAAAVGEDDDVGPVVEPADEPEDAVAEELRAPVRRSDSWYAIRTGKAVTVV